MTEIKELISSKNYTIWYKLKLLCLMLVAATLPFSIALNNIALGALILTWILSGNHKYKFRLAIQNKLLLLFLSVFVLQVVGLFYTSEMGEGLGKIERKAALFVLPLVLASSERIKRKHILYVLTAFILACTVLCFYALFSILNVYGSLNNVAALTETIDEIINLHHAYSGMYVVFAAALSLYIVLFKEFDIKISFKIVYFFLSAFLFIFLIILAARTSVIISFILIVILLLSNLKLATQKRFIVSTVLVFLAAAIVVITFPNTKTKIVQFYELRGIHSPLTPRLIQWKCCFNILQEQDAWIFGVGTGDVQKHLQQCYMNEKFWGERYEYNAHSEFLEEMVRHGLFGVSLLLVSVLCPLALSIKRKKHLYIIFLIVFIMCSITESTLSRQKGVVFFALFNSMLAFSYLNKSKRHVQTTVSVL
ncbi:O-antigen ligase family protein [Pontibacter silvestris]|uniref:O-antigen ligase family protein n=1 Tax=Pontibacter silvestris TaxID=2305183 RepID=A0ABW4X0N9_9BACT|nr:O-antigen ligase family protein [Pontibacter silvestris]MCC9135134.1 O-antigen ligase family protein [Pontibacter silvestris]